MAGEQKPATRPHGETLQRVLIGAPVRQSAEVFSLYLESLRNLDTAGLDVRFRFYLHNSAHLEPLLETAGLRATWAHVRSDDVFVRNEQTHHWRHANIEQLIRMKNALFADAAVMGASHLFLVDSDLILNPRTLKHLLSRNVPIVSEVFWTRWQRDGPEQPNAWDFGDYGFFPDAAGRPVALEAWRKPGLYRVGGLGACTLIHRSAWEAGVSYQRLYNVSYWGEDRHFCLRAAALGFELFLDTVYPCTHLYRDEDVRRYLASRAATGDPGSATRGVGDGVPAR